MKKILVFTFALMTMSGFAQTKKALSEFGRELTEIMEHMKSYTLAVANQMPEEKYDFKPADDDTVRTFGEQMKHLVSAMKFQAETILEAKTFDPQKVVTELGTFERRKMTKAEIIAGLTTSFDLLIAKLSSMTDEQYSMKYKFPGSKAEPKSLRVFAMFVRDHITHHRAQAIVCLRMNGIEPVFYKPF